MGPVDEERGADVDVEDFVGWWAAQERRDIEAMIAGLAGAGGTADGEICRLRARVAVGLRLRRTGRSRVGCHAAHLAGEAALAACERTGVLRADRSGATRLARAAADAAAGLVAEEATVAVDELLAPFRPHLLADHAA